MLQTVKDIPFNIFDRELSLDWQNVVNGFRAQNETAKAATRDLIDTSFRRLRSAEGAFELLQNFKKIESKGAIKEQMASKLQDILEQFAREIDTVGANFAEHRCASWPVSMPDVECMCLPSCRHALGSHLQRLLSASLWTLTIPCSMF